MDDFQTAIKIAVIGSSSLRFYGGMVFVIFAIQAYSSYTWVQFAKTGDMTYITIYLILNTATTVGQYFSGNYHNCVGTEIAKVLYEKYGIDMARFRGEVKQSIEGRKWRHKFNRFVRSIDNCIGWVMSEIVGWSSILTNLFALALLIR